MRFLLAEMQLDWSSLVWKVLAVLALVVLNGFFVAAEFALVKVRETQLTPLLAKGNRRARMTRRVIQNLDRYLSAAQLGITLASLGLGWIGEPIFLALLQPVMDGLGVDSQEVRHTVAFIFGFSAITLLHITAGEQAPKWLAIQRPLPTALWVAHPLVGFCYLTYPFIWVLNQTSLWLLRRVGIEPTGEGETVHSEEELRLLFATTHEHSSGTALGRKIVLNALDLRRRIAREVMRPRKEIVALDTEKSMTECLEFAEKKGFSRFPLCEGGDLDRILGAVHLKKLFAMRLNGKSGADLVPVASKIVYVPETARLEKLLQLLLDRKLHLAIVVDEYGGTVGLITLENILEELVGQIQDEFDREKPMATIVGDQSWEILGTLPLHDLEELAGEPLAAEGITTTSGWITHRLGRFPKVGDLVTLAGGKVTVEEIKDKQAVRLHLRRTPRSEAAAATP